MAEERLKAEDLRSWSDTDLQAKLEALRRERWQSRLDTASGSQQQMHRVGVLRRQIARMLTIMQERRSATVIHSPRQGTRMSEGIAR